MPISEFGHEAHDPRSGATAGPADDIVELRIHGVSGTPPEHLLGCPEEMLQQLSGDKAAGVYRCGPCGNQPTKAGAGPATSPVREGYCWGGLTSGTATRALWLLFLPFLLINLAHWMLPPSITGRKAPAVSVTLLRLLGLAFTLALMLASVEVAMDIVGWQCAPVAHCATRLGPAKFLLNMPRGQQLMFTAIPVALMPLALLFLGRPNPPAPIPLTDPGRRAKKPRDGTPPDSAVTSERVPLAEPNFWGPDDSVKRLRACHVMAWTSGLGAVTLAPPVHYLEPSGTRTICFVLLWVQAGIVALSVAAAASTRISGRGGKSADRLTRPMWWSQWVAAAVLVTTLTVVAFTKPGPVQSPALPGTMTGLGWAINALLAVQIVLLAALFLFTARCTHGWARAAPTALRALWRPLGPLLRRRSADWAPPGMDRSDGFTPSLDGFGAAFVATIGLFVAAGFSAGVGLLAAQYVGAPVRSTAAAACQMGFRAKVLRSGADLQSLFATYCDPRRQGQLPQLPADFETRVENYNADTAIIVPPAYFAAAIVFSLLVLTLLAVVAVLWVNRIPRWARAVEAEVLKDYKASRDSDAKHRASAVARDRVLASLTDSAPRVLAALTVLAIAAFVLLGAVYAAGGFKHLPVWTPGVSTLSVAMLSGAAAGIVVLAVAAFRDGEKRRVVGVLWDVITFWPRANHPLTPPCYGERTVPELVGQLSYLAPADSTRGVVLAAHSQGSIIAAATVLQTADPDLPDIGLLTFGCPLRRLYARNFPAYFGANTIQAIHARLPNRWINLWALTDPIGSWVLTNANPYLTDAPKTVDCRILDVTSLDREERGSFPPICGHSGYWTRPEYDRAERLLLGSLPAYPRRHPSGSIRDIR